MLSSSELTSVIRERIESVCEENVRKHGLTRKGTDFRLRPFSPYASTDVSIELTEDGIESHYYRVSGTAHVVILADVVPAALAKMLDGTTLAVKYSFTIDPILETMKSRVWELQGVLDERNSDGPLF